MLFTEQVGLVIAILGYIVGYFYAFYDELSYL